MSAASFQLVFDGEAVRSGSMDVYELAPALLAAGDLMKGANTFLNGDRAKVSVRVEADFKRSSFEIGLLLDQGLIEQAKQLVLGEGIRDAEYLIRAVFGVGLGTTALLTSLIKLYKALKGQKIEKTTPSGDSTLIINVGGQVFNHVDKTTVELDQQEPIRRALQRILRTLLKPGIDILEVRKEKETLEKITKEEAQTFVEDAPLAEQPSDVASDNVSHRNTVIRLVKPSFRRGNKYQVTEGDNEYHVTIEDQKFLDAVDNDQVKFAAHDRFRVRLRQEITPGEKKDAIQHFVEEVTAQEQARPATQNPLPYTDQASSSQTDQT